MRDILSAIAAPLLALIGLKLGHIRGRNKTIAETDAVKLGNLQGVVNFYKGTFDDLKVEIGNLTNRCKIMSREINDFRAENEEFRKENIALKQDIHELRAENIALKKDIHALNEQLKKHTSIKIK